MGLSSNSTATNKEQYALAKEEYAEIRTQLDKMRLAVQEIGASLDSQNIPYMPNRPNWKEE